MTSSRPPDTPISRQEPIVVSGPRPAARPIAPSAITPAEHQNSARRPIARSTGPDTSPAHDRARRERGDVQPAGRVAQVELVAQLGDDQPRRRLKIRKPREEPVGDPGESIAGKLHAHGISINHIGFNLARSDLRRGPGRARTRAPRRERPSSKRTRQRRWIHPAAPTTIPRAPAAIPSGSGWVVTTREPTSMSADAGVPMSALTHETGKAFGRLPYHQLPGLRLDRHRSPRPRPARAQRRPCSRSDWRTVVSPGALALARVVPPDHRQLRRHREPARAPPPAARRSPARRSCTAAPVGGSGPSSSAPAAASPCARSLSSTSRPTVTP